MVRRIIKEEMGNIKSEVGDKLFETVRYDLAARLFDEIIANDELEEFLTLRAYDHID